MIRTVLKRIRANLLAEVLIGKWDELDPRVRALLIDQAGPEHFDQMAIRVAANVRDVDPAITAKLKKLLKPLDAQVKQWDYKRKRSNGTTSTVEASSVPGESVHTPAVFEG